MPARLVRIAQLAGDRFERIEFLIGEQISKVGPLTRFQDRPDLSESLLAVRRHAQQRGATMDGVWSACDKSLRFHAVRESAEAASRQRNLGGDLVDAHSATRGTVQTQEHLQPRAWGSCRTLDISMNAALKVVCRFDQQTTGSSQIARSPGRHTQTLH